LYLRGLVLRGGARGREGKGRRKEEGEGGKRRNQAHKYFSLKHPLPLIR